MNVCEICEVLPKIDPNLLLVDGTFWNANLRAQDQTLLGTSFITAKRHVPELDYLTEQEEAEFLLVRNALLRAMRQAFQPMTFNVSCLKNDTYRHDLSLGPDATHVHWHIKPRYNTTITIDGQVFADPMPGRYLTGQYEKTRPSQEIAYKIAETIRSNLPTL